MKSLSYLNNKIKSLIDLYYSTKDILKKEGTDEQINTFRGTFVQNMSTWENIEPQYHTAIKLSLTGCSQCSG